MKKTGIRIPPVLVTLFFALLMWLVHRSFPAIPAPMSIRLTIAAIFTAVGVFFSIAGVMAFIKAKTTVNPLTPGASSSLVTTGIYRRTRNPMYVGFLFFLLALAGGLFNLYSLSLVAGYVMYMNRVQIQAEETALEGYFGDDFRDYKKRVRRWL